MGNAVSCIDDIYNNHIIYFPRWVTFKINGALLIIAELAKTKGSPCNGTWTHLALLKNREYKRNMAGKISLH